MAPATKKASKAAPATKAAAKSNASKVAKPAAVKASAPKATATKASAPKKAAPPKVNGVKKAAAPVTKTKPAAKSASKSATPADKEPVKANIKRRRDESEEDDEAEAVVPPAKKAKQAPVKPAAKPAAKPAVVKKEILINQQPSEQLEVYVFGDGEFGELGLGNKKFEGKGPTHVKKPRVNHILKDLGVVQIEAGGMHAIALTNQNKIYTWGVNDEKALGRETNWDGGDDEDDDDDDAGLDPTEATPAEVDMSIAGDHKFTQVAATNNASFVLTDIGTVYGWGTFRGHDGVLGFSQEVKNQVAPIQVEGLKHITSLAAGGDHMLALDKDGKIFTWGTADSFQLGRKPVSRHGGPRASLHPMVCGRFSKAHYAVQIAAGTYHSFYIDNHGKLWSWGLNNFSQTGHSDAGGRDGAVVAAPKAVQSLKDHDIVSISGGEHHSVACSADGETFSWGRVDFAQVGLKKDDFPEDDVVYDENDRPRIINKPTLLPNLKSKTVACNGNTSIVIATNGEAYAWGASANKQTGLATTDDVEVPTQIKGPDVDGKKLTWAGLGGQYGMLASVRK
ncbi:RCC1/BLIP-II [Xylariaceae sp. FL0016]|nr:RCC1/BLIP-II [Xylariaceae sp. FL0016]